MSSSAVGGLPDFERAVADPTRIHGHLDGLAARADARRFELLVQDGVRFHDLLFERERVVELVRRSLADASYRPGRARLARSYIHGKWREIARLAVLDLVVHGVVNDVVSERLEARLSSRVYSYRKKRSSWDALRWLARVVKAHRERRPDPRTRGLYVLRADIERYAPSIPMTEQSPLWPELRRVAGLLETSPHWAMLLALVLQPLDGLDGAPAVREKGVLFGAPTSNALMNLYLAPLDDALVALRGAYARFGDDILFAHADPDVVREARRVLDAVLAERALAANGEKCHVLFWNGAARPSSVWPAARGVTHVPFLGADVRFDGTVTLPPRKWAVMLSDLKGRIRRTSDLLDEEDPRERAKALAAMVNEAFDVRADLGLSHRLMLSDLISDRIQLRELDHLLARWVAEAATRRRGPRVFREMPYRWLRSEGGLASRVVARNAKRPTRG